MNQNFEILIRAFCELEKILRCVDLSTVFIVYVHEKVIVITICSMIRYFLDIDYPTSFV